MKHNKVHNSTNNSPVIHNGHNPPKEYTGNPQDLHREITREITEIEELLTDHPEWSVAAQKLDPSTLHAELGRWWKSGRDNRTLVMLLHRASWRPPLFQAQCLFFGLAELLGRAGRSRLLSLRYINALITTHAARARKYDISKHEESQ